MNERAGHHFTAKDFESIGYHFLDSLLDYCDPDRTKVKALSIIVVFFLAKNFPFQRDRIIHELEENLRQAIQMKLISRGINPATLGDIDLDQYSSEEDSR